MSRAVFEKLLKTIPATESAARPATADALRRLLAEGGPLARLATPVALLGRTGKVLAGNESAARLAEALGRAGLRVLVAQAIAAGGAIDETLSPEPDERADETPAVYETSLMVLDGGDSALLVARDVSAERALRQALVDSRRRYKDLVELSSDFAWETDSEGRFVFVSPKGALGYEADELVGCRPQDLLDPTVQYLGTLPFGSPTAVADVDVWFRRRDGTSACLSTSALPILDGNGDWRGDRGICRDVTGERRRDAALALAQTRKQLLAHVIRAVREEIDPTAMLATAATETARVLGGAHSRVYRVAPRDGFEVAAAFGEGAIADTLEAEILQRVRAEGEIVTAIEYDSCVICAPTVYQKRINGALLIVRDRALGAWDDEERGLAADVAGQLAVAFEQIQNHAKLERLSRTDELSGLLNRRAFFAELRDRLSRSATGALFFVDLDNFKLVNDVHGHQRGDEALVAVAALLRQTTRSGDLVSRFGGDEFALWLERIDGNGAANRARELLSAARGLAQFSGSAERPLGLSIGVAVHDPVARPETVTGLTDRADAAMYRVKHGDKGGFVIADTEHDGAAEAAP